MNEAGRGHWEEVLQEVVEESMVVEPIFDTSEDKMLEHARQ